MYILKIIKFLANKALSFTILGPLDKDFPRLPSGKYGDYICQICMDRRAKHWHEKTLVKFCSTCALKSRGCL